MPKASREGRGEDSIVAIVMHAGFTLLAFGPWQGGGLSTLRTYAPSPPCEPRAHCFPPLWVRCLPPSPAHRIPPCVYVERRKRRERGKLSPAASVQA